MLLTAAAVVLTGALIVAAALAVSLTACVAVCVVELSLGAAPFGMMVVGSELRPLDNDLYLFFHL